MTCDYALIMYGDTLDCNCHAFRMTHKTLVTQIVIAIEFLNLQDILIKHYRYNFLQVLSNVSINKIVYTQKIYERTLFLPLVL